PATGVLQPGDLGVLGQRAATVRQLGERGVDPLQVEQALLVPLVGSDGVLPPCAAPARAPLGAQPTSGRPPGREDVDDPGAGSRNKSGRGG
ncbi:hypothetical protein NL292_25975, partial [Klebsiella pneumoniae]|nr:hypothetical protein [Klebsiella pneumoniae]